jgi:hypothetical protein
MASGTSTASLLRLPAADQYRRKLFSSISALRSPGVDGEGAGDEIQSFGRRARAPRAAPARPTTLRRWRRLVRIAYFDEAGTALESQEPFMVVGGVLVHGDTQWLPIESHTRKIIDTYVPEALQAKFVFHASHLFSDHPLFRRLISPEQRFQILRDFLGIIVQYDLPISYGAVTRRDFAKALPRWKPARRVSFSHQMAFTLCAMGFQGWFFNKAADEVAICVADRNEQTQLSLKENFVFLREQGLPANPILALFNFVDALHFAASQESIGLQLADSVAFVIKRHLMGKASTEEFYKLIEPQIVCDPVSALWPMPGWQPKPEKSAG